MSNKDKLQKDFENFNQDIERLGEQQIKIIREKADAIKEEASKKGEAVEFSINKPESNLSKKKVNT